MSMLMRRGLLHGKLYYASVENSWKSVRSPVGNVPWKAGGPEQMEVALIDKGGSFYHVMAKVKLEKVLTLPFTLQFEWI